MKAVFRTTNPDEIELITRLRIAFVRDLHPEFSDTKIDALVDSTRSYFNEMISEQRYTGILGEIDTQIACCAGILHYDLPPIDGERRKTGHILNFFTYPEFRRRGCAFSMMSFIIELSKREGFERLFLNATAMGEGLYRKFGFKEQQEKALILLLNVPQGT